MTLGLVHKLGSDRRTIFRRGQISKGTSDEASSGVMGQSQPPEAGRFAYVIASLPPALYVSSK